MQYVQRKMGYLEIKLIKGEDFTNEIEAKLINHYKTAFNEKCIFNFNYVNSIEKEINGKFLPLKQFIK